MVASSRAAQFRSWQDPSPEKEEWVWAPNPNQEAICNWYPLEKEHQLFPVESHWIYNHTSGYIPCLRVVGQWKNELNGIFVNFFPFLFIWPFLFYWSLLDCVFWFPFLCLLSMSFLGDTVSQRTYLSFFSNSLSSPLFHNVPWVMGVGVVL